MEPENVRFGGGAASTVLHPIIAVWMLIAIVLILLLPRRQVIIPWLISIFCLPLGQVLVVGGIHFSMARILIIVGLVRVLISKNRFAGKINGIDTTFVMLAVSGLVVFSLQWLDVHQFIYSVGAFLDMVGAYFILRFLIRDGDDLRQIVNVFAIIAVTQSACMVAEQITKQNPFGLLGGFRLTPAERNGQIRSQGAFEVYITAGVFGATLVPLFVWFWSVGRHKVAAAAGLIGATAMTICSNSSTSWLAYVGGLVGLCFWPLRRRMRAVRWAIVILLVGLHLVMKAPVWALIGRIDLTGSSSGYHRYMLVDNCIRHFRAWWLLGCKDYNTWGWDMWDLSNQYVAYALVGGIWTLVLFVAVISRSFGLIGKTRKAVAGNLGQEWRVWCTGAALLTHVVACFGIGYFDQLQYSWYALLAVVSAAAAESRSPAIAKLGKAHTFDPAVVEPLVLVRDPISVV